MVALFQEAAKNGTIDEISFSGVTVEREALPSMVDMLTTHKRRRISFNTCSGCGAEALAPTIPVECIRIVNSGLSNAGFAALGRQMEFNSVLTQLELYELEFVEAQIEGLSLGLGTSKSLRTLELSYCTFDDDAIKDLARGMSRNSSLESFHWSC